MRSFSVALTLLLSRGAASLHFDRPVDNNSVDASSQDQTSFSTEELDILEEVASSFHLSDGTVLQTYLRGVDYSADGEEDASEDGEEIESEEGGDGETEEECRARCARMRRCRSRDCGPEAEKECLEEECGISPDATEKMFHLSEGVATSDSEEVSSDSEDGQNGHRSSRSHRNSGRNQRNQGRNSGQNRSTSRDDDWLTSHNDYREQYQVQYGYSFVPLTWSTGLAALAQAQADSNAQNCRNALASGTPYGQNIAMRQGSTNERSPDTIVTSWMGNIDSGNANDRARQVLWRATHYVGCGDAAGSNCYASVCFYTKPGNCNMRRYGGDWETATFADDSPCGNECPPEGCP